MPASVLLGIDSAIAPRISWNELADRARSYRPNVVIQVARKMPRLAEYFQLNFGINCLAVSDLAIPFIHRYLRGARVAILDDVINVGSTLRHAESMTLACAPADVKSFALGCRRMAGLSDSTECVWPQPISEGQYRRLTEFVPSVLLDLPKPYDLEFPILPCRLNAPFRGVGDVRQWLEYRFGADRVSYHSGKGRSGLARLTVELDSGQPGLFKVRLYLDAAQRQCNFVPMAIPPSLQELTRAELRHPLALRLLAATIHAMSGAPPNTSVWDEEPLSRARLFAHSLDFGLGQLDAFHELLGVRDEQVLSVADMNLLFGPVDLEAIVPELTPPSSSAACSQVSAESPFATFLLTTLHGHAFLERVRSGTPAKRGYNLFLAFFNELAVAVGASDPDTFSMGWPFNAQQVVTNPYLRLRIGPTFEDLVTLYKHLLDPADERSDRAGLRREISAFLDHAIDVGAVVPTIARYHDTLYRVYRKGESESQDRAINRVMYAWQMSKTPMSLTRFTKLNAILAMSGEVPPILCPETLSRGNIATLDQSILDWGENEVGAFLRNTGRLTDSK